MPNRRETFRALGYCNFQFRGVAPRQITVTRKISRFLDNRALSAYIAMTKFDDESKAYMLAAQPIFKLIDQCVTDKNSLPDEPLPAFVRSPAGDLMRFDRFDGLI